MPRVSITREQLYEEVWSKPIMHLAKSYGLSDAGLAKLCRRYEIPRPPRGYWAKLHAGQTPQRISLPPREGAGEIELNPPPEEPLEKSGSREKLQDLTEHESQDEAKIVVATQLRGAHPLVIAAREQLHQAERGEAGILVTSGSRPLDISVSQSQLRRALLICDALLKALNTRGYEVSTGPQIKILDESISFGIKESITTVREQPEQHDLSGDYEFGYSRYVKRLEPSGKLTLFIEDADRYWASGCRKQWRDGKKQRLEDVLSRVVAGLIQVAARKREHGLEMKARRQAEAEAAELRRQAAQRRAELIAQQTAERDRLQELLKQADGLRQSRAIRELVDAVRQGDCSADGKLDDWMTWALMHADRLDPTTESPPCVLDEEVPPEEPRRW